MEVKELSYLKSNGKKCEKLSKARSINQTPLKRVEIPKPDGQLDTTVLTCLFSKP